MGFRIFVLLIFSFNSLAMNQGLPSNFDCKLDEKEEPPFYISDGYKQEDLIYENFRDIEDDRKIRRYIPKGSIVYTPPELYEAEATSTYRVPVEVLSVPEDDVEQTLRKSLYHDPEQGKNFAKREFRSQVRGLKNKKRVESKDQGFIDRRSLKRAGEYVFFVNEDAPVYKTNNGRILNDYKVRLKMKDGKFVVSSCCFPNEDAPEGRYCHEFYMFEVLDRDSSGEEIVVENEIIYGLGCSFLSNIRPIPKEDSDVFENIANLLKEYSEVAGSIPEMKLQSMELIPEITEPNERPSTSLVKFPVAQNLDGPFNSYHYGQDDTENSDVFMRPVTNCAFLQVLKEFNKECNGPGCKVQFGNMYHLKEWKNHGTHYSGNCIDIRFFRTDSDKPEDGKINLKWKKEKYDREKTEKFIDILIKSGATNIFINDTTLQKRYNGAKYNQLVGGEDIIYTSRPQSVSGHDNHLHFCLHPEDRDVRNACLEGVPEDVNPLPEEKPQTSDTPAQAN